MRNSVEIRNRITLNSANIASDAHFEDVESNDLNSTYFKLIDN